MIGRAGGAPTFALGMAQMCAGVCGGRTAMALWYHFAIMFEALFILTTIDAGTRVGRFIMQDLLGYLWKPLGNTQSAAGNFAATLLFVAAWGWFLYQGVVDPLGGIRSLWPIFGVANQLLAVIALALGTTVLLKMGRARYAWVTLLPLAWLLAVTLTAGLMLVFSANPRLGFLAQAASLAEKLPTAAPAEALTVGRPSFNAEGHAAGPGGFPLFVVVVVLAFSPRCGGSCCRAGARLICTRNGMCPGGSRPSDAHRGHRRHPRQIPAEIAGAAAGCRRDLAPRGCVRPSHTGGVREPGPAAPCRARQQRRAQFLAARAAARARGVEIFSHAHPATAGAGRCPGRAAPPHPSAA